MQHKWWHHIVVFLVDYLVITPVTWADWFVYPLWDSTIGWLHPARDWKRPSVYHNLKFVAAFIAGWILWYTICYLILAFFI